MEPDPKKVKLDIFDFPTARETRTPEEVAESYAEAVKSHPFYDNVHSAIDFYDSGTIKDGRGQIIGVVLREALPKYAASMASELLASAAVRTSLRSMMFGGESPLSGIAGYFDYRGSPVELKSRKTSFTYEHEAAWPAVFPVVDYVSELYRHVAPERWKAQNDAIPDVVRIHGTPFSTLTINSRFRTASHTDVGDFDGGYSCIACLDGQFKGLALAFDDFGINVLMQPRDVMIFDSHHFHSNTEVELSFSGEDWKRLTCVFYYRAALGEPASYAEYRRRLEKSKQDTSFTPVVSNVRVKENGTNLNRPSPVYPIFLSPFWVPMVAHCLQHCASEAQCVHDAMTADGSRLAEVMFGEPLSTSDGIPLRGEEEKLKANSDSASRPLSRLGGFSETNLMVSTAVEKKKYLNSEFLSHFISAQLLDMWKQARGKWLELVGREWTHMLALNPERKDFLWKNQSEMNSAFFDLCEVGKQVMLGLLGKEAALPKEEQAFWTMYAVHLNAACAEELNMPHVAMSLRKLNVKLKDFNFGGTRYFKDMPPEEQKRRMERKQRIEEARRHGMSSGAHEKRANWLTNDSFDYQTEDCVVDYAQHKWVPPALHAKEITKNVRSGELPTREGVVRVLVVLPDPQSKVDCVDCKLEVSETVRCSCEWERLMSSPAVHRVLAAAQRNLQLPDSVTHDNIEIRFAFHSRLPTDMCDFVVLQHVLSCIPDDVLASAYIRRSAALCSGCVFVVETDVQCRQYYTLKCSVRCDYDAVAPLFFQQLHRVSYGTKAARVRTKGELESLIPTVCCARYKLQGSPLNTTVHVVAPAPPR
ncbi:DNA J-binding protein, putative [Leishmania donovani]|uniref:Thymine dioxygenase JBP1 n=1 Tax=Leishmania donovani TaxID=5661 RepID=A0A3Q8IAX2_LEIDO|nr:DNA J-binding protein, putative [Leishmania donovani]AYU76597.1 DNA J-binding protein, putative [Leishmania donovani]TPP41638.1 Oxygenase domain of the 2OGFeDO family protein [Leishmania donovani]CBZ32114.1 DNA J-binding protein, putative [Leishmania donovani]